MPSDRNDVTKDLFTGYSVKKSVFTPYYLSTNFFSYGNSKGTMKMEFTPTQHGGMMRISYPPYIPHEEGDGQSSGPFSQYRRISIVLNGGADAAEVISSPLDGTLMSTGYSKKNNGGTGNETATSFAHFFAVAIYSGETGDQRTSRNDLKEEEGGGQTPIYISNTNTWIDFPPEIETNQFLTLRFASSFISREQAIENLRSELPTDKDFLAMKEEAYQDWRTNSLFGRISIKKSAEGYSPCELHDLYSIFHTSLYRASLYPRQLTEVSSQGKQVHWSPYANKPEDRVKEGFLSADSGFWDAWNSVYPLLSLSHRPVLGQMMNGWLNAYQEGDGWLPKWSSPGYRLSMIGTMRDVSLADAIVKQIPGFDPLLAYEAIRKDAFQIPPSERSDGSVGRVCLESYLKYGYVPRGAKTSGEGEEEGGEGEGKNDDCYDSISRSLNYLQSDYAIAQAALYLNHSEDAKVLLSRSQNYRLIFDKETAFFRARFVENESFVLPFDQFGWGTDYTEGGPWQYRFYVPYDLPGLRSLYNSLVVPSVNNGKENKEEKDGSNDHFCSVLQSMHTTEPVIHVGGNDVEIKEMTELVANCWAQYSHNDQPSHHVLYMHFYGGYRSHCSDQGRYWIRKTLRELYQPTISMFPGDEDNGEMAAWFLLSSLGLYARSPGSLEYVLGIPLFGQVEIDISDNLSPSANNSNGTIEKKLTIVAHNIRPENIRIDKILWNGQEIGSEENGISYSELAKGGRLEFFMSS
jgi:predicted alpha-1,2-mannosidase